MHFKTLHKEIKCVFLLQMIARSPPRGLTCKMTQKESLWASPMPGIQVFIIIKPTQKHSHKHLSPLSMYFSSRQQSHESAYKNHSGNEHQRRIMGASKFQVFIIIDSITIKSKLTLFNSHLGQWEAVLVEGVPTLLNLTLYSSCGLIFGRLGSTR